MQQNPESKEISVTAGVHILTDHDRKCISQERTPLIDAIQRYTDGKPAFFRVPGHRFARGVDPAALKLLGEKAYRADLTEAEGLDDLHHPSGAIMEAEELAAELYGSDHCWFLVNGTTSGNEAMILSAVGPGEKILADRNAHRSVLQGLILSGAVPVWIMPEEYHGWDITGSVNPVTVEKALCEDPEIRAVFITSPTYYGIASDIRRIAEICHAHGIPLLVDEAHGSHLNFLPPGAQGPEEAVEAGADLVSQSTHKTCGSMTESSMLHLQGGLISRERTDACLKLVTSTSPNYLLMASLDGARHLMATKGTELVKEALDLAQMAEDKLSGIPGIRVLRHETRKDPLRLVFSAADAGITGYRMHDLLYRTGGVSCELSDPSNVVCVITWGNTEDDITRLADTCRTVVEKYGSSSDIRRPDEPSGSNFLLRQAPPVRMTPRQAFYSSCESTALQHATGRIAAEAVIPYPPGVPIVCPGEELTYETVRDIMTYRSRKSGEDIPEDILVVSD